MAEYINDAGSYNMDALFNGTKGTDYNYNEANKITWFSPSGYANTGYTLPNNEWVMFEVYNPDSYTNSLGGDNVLSKKEFTTDLTGGIAAVLSAWYTAYDGGTSYTTYDVVATHYKGSDLADVYYADETATFGTATVTDGTFTGYGTVWLVTDQLLSTQVNLPAPTNHYPMISNMNDVVGSLNGTGTNITYSGGFAVFNGSSSYGTILSSGTRIGNNAAISFWFKMDAFPPTPDNQYYILLKYFSNAERELAFANYDTNNDGGGDVILVQEIGDNGYYTSTTDNPFDTINKWYHVIISTDSSANATVYINGVSEHTSTPPSVPTVQGTTYIGAEVPNSHSYHDGNIADIKRYSAPVTAAQAKAMYQAEKPRFI